MIMSLMMSINLSKRLQGLQWMDSMPGGRKILCETFRDGINLTVSSYRRLFSMYKITDLASSDRHLGAPFPVACISFFS
jgi:hypothetical protein